MISLQITSDVERLTAELGQMGLRQVPYALSRTINAMLLNIQDVQRAEQRKAFVIRRPTFIERLVKIGRGDFATKDRLVGRVGYQGERSDLLAKFEAGGPKRSPSGAPIWTPLEAQRSKADVITKGNRPKGLRLRLTSSKAGVKVYKGDRRTFMIRQADGSGLVLQRLGRRARGRRARRAQAQAAMRAGFRYDEGTRTLFVYLRRPPQLPASLGFLERAQRVLDTSFALTFREELDAALFSSARPRAGGRS